jgi:hypothetical protein
MSYTKTYNFKDHKRGDTLKEIEFQVEINDQPLDFDNIAAINCQFRLRSPKGQVVHTATIDDGITITGPGAFKIDGFLLDFPPVIMYYDIEFVFTDGTVRTYVEGTLKLTQDTTNIPTLS